ARIAVSAEVALADEAVLRPVEDGAPSLEFADAVGRFLRVELRHPPDVEELPAAHRVAEVDLPVVFLRDVAERRGHAALGHHGVRLAEKRLADEPRVRALRGGLDRRAQSRAARADDDDVVLDRLDLVHVKRVATHRSVPPRREVVDAAGADHPDVEVGEADPEEADPGELHVPLVEEGDLLPELELRRRLAVAREAVLAAADEVAERVAAERE